MFRMLCLNVAFIVVFCYVMYFDFESHSVHKRFAIALVL